MDRKKSGSLIIAAVSASALVALPAAARPRASAYAFVEVTRGLDAPTDVVTAPNDPSTLYVTQQRGDVKIVHDGRVAGTFIDLRKLVQHDDNERGLLSIAFSPRYAQNGLFYVYYTDNRGDLRIIEYHANSGVPDLNSARSLFDVPHPWPNHNGGDLVFDRKGFLYTGTGDGGTDPAGRGAQPGDPHNNAQNPRSQLGKLFRTNPARANPKWQMVGLGLRNPWRFSFDRKTGDLWLADVGAGAWEEIDHRPRATVGAVANYGWRRFEGRHFYDTLLRLSRLGKRVTPVWNYAHHGDLCAVIGGFVYRGPSAPAARGRYFFGDLCGGNVWSFPVGKVRGTVRASTVTQLPQRITGLTSFGEASNGDVYAVGQSGVLYELRTG